MWIKRLLTREHTWGVLQALLIVTVLVAVYLTHAQLPDIG